MRQCRARAAAAFAPTVRGLVSGEPLVAALGGEGRLVIEQRMVA
jgi:hypothetical protein